MTTTDAAREQARRPNGQFGEQPHTDPGQVTLELTDPDGNLTDGQVAYLNQIAALLDNPDPVIRTERSCSGYRSARISGALGEPGRVTEVSADFTGDHPEPSELSVQSTWAWDEPAGPYDESSVTAHYAASEVADHDRVRADMARLAAVQVRLDERVNKPVHRRAATRELASPFLLCAGHRHGTDWLQTYHHSDVDQFTFTDGRFTSAVVGTTTFGRLRVEGENLTQVVEELGQGIQISNRTDIVPGGWRVGPPARDIVERWLLGG